MIAYCRGAVLPETALTIGLALLLVLGTAQVTIIGFSQVSADGAAFIAAHTTAVNGSADPHAAIATAFPNFSADSISAATGASQLRQALVTKTVGGFIALPGAASTYTLNGADLEFGSQSASPQPFSFGASATLANYCPPVGRCVLPSTYAMYVAQSVDEQTSSQGWNGAFAEWRCHQQAFASVNFPNTRPSLGLKGTPYDPNNPHGVEAPIYAWDNGNHKCN